MSSRKPKSKSRRKSGHKSTRKPARAVGRRDSRRPPAPKRRAAAPAFLLAQLSDTHLLGDPAARQGGWRTQVALDAVLEAIRAQRPDALLVTGDLVHDESAMAYSRLAAALHRFDRPVCYLSGNHDDPQALHTAFAPLGEAAPARILLGGWQLLLLDDHLPGSDAGELPQEQLDQLAYWLLRHPEPALIVLHHPPVPVGSRWLDASALRNGPALLRLASLYPQVRAIVCGHVHQEVDMSVNGLRILATPSTGRQFLPQSAVFAVDPQALPGFRCLWLYPSGRLRTKVIRVAAARVAGDPAPSQPAPC